MSKKKILHIDDDKDITTIAKKILEFSAFEVTSCNDPKEITSWNDYDLIILDWMLPETNAMEVYTRAVESGFGGLALLVTARALSNSERLFIEKNNIAYMRKPFGPTELIATVRSVFAKGNE